MNIKYTRQFIKDVKKYPSLKTQVDKVISKFKNLQSLEQLTNIKKTAFRQK